MSTKSLDKALRIFVDIVANSEGQSMNDLSKTHDLPQATLYRHVSALTRHGLVTKNLDGRLTAGALLSLYLNQPHFLSLVSNIARNHVRSLSKRLGTFVHLGILRDDMVTYLIKAAPDDATLFTEENKQLEAYCSGIGKVLLADLDKQELAAYFSTAPFPVLTNKTITDPEKLQKELKRVNRRGYATDMAEIMDDLFCIAVPIKDNHGKSIAGLSISTNSAPAFTKNQRAYLGELQATANAIRKRLFGKTGRTV